MRRRRFDATQWLEPLIACRAEFEFRISEMGKVGKYLGPDSLHAIETYRRENLNGTEAKYSVGVAGSRSFGSIQISFGDDLILVLKQYNRIPWCI